MDTMPAIAPAVEVCTHPAYAQLCAIADPIIKHYRTDLTEHDAAHLQAIGARDPFIWSVRDMGTHLYSLTGTRNSVANGWKGFAECIRTIGKECKNAGRHLYHWNGYTLRKIGIDDAARMVEKWERTAPPESPENFAARHKRGGW